MSGAVILARLNTLNEAHIVAGLLCQNGIPASVGEAGFASIDWFAIPALGDVGVYVRRVALKTAQDIVIETAAIGPAELEAEFGPYEPSRRYGRAAVWYFWLSQFYVVQVAIIALFMAAHQVIPKSWFQLEDYVARPYYGAGGTVDLQGIADGLLLVFFILIYFVLEAASERQTSDKDPQP